MRRHLVIAVRGGPDAKTRLAERLDAARRDALIEAMLDDMLAAVAQSAEIQRPFVVTPTPALARLAARRGAVVIHESNSGGLNGAFACARAHIAATDPEALVSLLPGDLPTLHPRELDAALCAAAPARVVLAPALADGGTGALVVPAAMPLPLAFGPGSFAKHLAAVRALDAEAHVVHAASFGFDLDRPADLDAFLSLGGGGRTAEALVSDRLGDAAA